MNRRSFFSGLAAMAATATLDPERLLWRPGKLISIPKPRPVPMISVNSSFHFYIGDIITFGKHLRQWRITAVMESGYNLRPAREKEQIPQRIIASGENGAISAWRRLTVKYVDNTAGV